MAFSLEPHFVTQFAQNLELSLQMRGGVYEPYVDVGMHNGESAVAVDFMGPIEMDEIVSRGAPVNLTDPDLNRVFVYPSDYEAAVGLTKEDQLRTLNDPTSKVLQSLAMAARRKRDAVIRDAFFGDMRVGKNGAGTEAFDTTNHRVDAAIGSSGDTGLNAAKIKKAVELLGNAEVDLVAETPVIAVNSTQLANLWNDDEYINTNYGSPVLDDGTAKNFLGCKFVVTNDLPSYLTYTAVPVWVPSGMHLGVWGDIAVDVGERKDIQGRKPWQAKINQTIGATRTEAGRVIMIECV